MLDKGGLGRKATEGVEEESLARLGLGFGVGRENLAGIPRAICPKSACFAHRNTFRVFAASECRPNPMGPALRGDRQVQFQQSRRNARL